MEASPLILTLQLNEEAFHFFNSRRQIYFPPERNFLSAHLTLFHHLPLDKAFIEKEIINYTSSQETLLLNVTDVVSIGKGVAYKIECLPLQKLHKALQEDWQPWLTPQDKQKLWPHITVQNKVTPPVANKTLEEVKASFKPFIAHGIGFSLWSYEGGPWKFIRHFPFKR
jgi:hypothetical protein